MKVSWYLLDLVDLFGKRLPVTVDWLLTNGDLLISVDWPLLADDPCSFCRK